MKKTPKWKLIVIQRILILTPPKKNFRSNVIVVPRDFGASIFLISTDTITRKNRHRRTVTTAPKPFLLQHK